MGRGRGALREWLKANPRPVELEETLVGEAGQRLVGLLESQFGGEVPKLPESLRSPTDEVGTTGVSKGVKETTLRLEVENFRGEVGERLLEREKGKVNSAEVAVGCATAA